MYIEPPHQAWDTDKLNAMIETLKNGGTLPTILICENQAYSGSHRLAAWSQMEIEPDYFEISGGDYVKIMESQNLDPIYDQVTDFEPFLEEAIWLKIAPETVK